MTIFFATVISLNIFDRQITIDPGGVINFSFSKTIAYDWQGKMIFKEELRPGDRICINIGINPYFDNQLIAHEIILGPPKIIDQDFIWAQESWVYNFLRLDKNKLDYRIENLGSKNFWVRERAVLVLRDLGRETSYPLLIQGIHTKDPEIIERSNKLLDGFWLR